MIVKVPSSTIIGIAFCPVEAEIDISPGLPRFSTAGLLDVVVWKSKDRIKAAIKNAGYHFPDVCDGEPSGTIKQRFKAARPH